MKLKKIVRNVITGLPFLLLLNCSENASPVGSSVLNEQISKTRVSSNNVAIKTWDFTPNSTDGWNWTSAYDTEHFTGGNTSIYVIETKGGDYRKELSPSERNTFVQAAYFSIVLASLNGNYPEWEVPSYLEAEYTDGSKEIISDDFSNPVLLDRIWSDKYDNYNRYKIVVPVNLKRTEDLKSIRLHIPSSLGSREIRKVAYDRICLETSIDDLASKNIPFRLKNRWSKKYMHIENKKGLLEVGDLGHPLWWSAQWYFEKAPDGFYRIRNRWQGGDDYIHVQDRSDYVEVSEMRYESWWSAQWEVKNFENEHYVQFRNRWKKNDVINNESKAQYAQSSNSTYPTGWWSSQWIIEVVE